MSAIQKTFSTMEKQSSVMKMKSSAMEEDYDLSDLEIMDILLGSHQVDEMFFFDGTEEVVVNQ